MANDLSGVRERFRNLLVEKREIDIRAIENRAEILLDTQNVDETDLGCGGWGDISGADDEQLSHGGATFAHLDGLAEAWGTPGSRFEGDAEVGRRLNLAWKFYHRFVHAGCEFPNNWWAWQIGIPMHMGNVMVLAGDAFDEDIRESLVDTMKYLVDHIRTEMTGANGMWGAMNYVRYALMAGDTDYIDRASSWAAQECEIRPVNGILSDFSYSFHGSAVHMGYGRSHFADVGRYVYVMGDSAWQLPEDALSNYVNWLLEFVQWTIVEDGIDPFIIGREISRGESALKATSIIDGALLASSAPIPRRDEVLAFCKQAVNDHLEPTNPVAKELADELMDDPAGPLYGARYWPVVEYFVARRSGFTASVKMSSTQTKSWFSINQENLKAWHTSDGHLILRPRGDAFMNGVVPSMDWDRLTGITRSDGIKMPRETEGQSPFVAGVSDGQVGCCGVDFVIENEDGDTLCAKKSWFFIGDVIVALGSDILCDGDGEVETIIRQVALPEQAGAQETLQNLDVDMIEDFDCVYLFPDPMKVKTYTEERIGRWSEINLRSGRVPTDEQARNFAFTLISHGVRPQGEGYVMVYLPGATSEGARSWWENKPLEVVQNDEQAHTVQAGGRTLSVRWGVGAGIEG